MAKIVLIGAGHAHLFVASHAHFFQKKGHQLVVVDPGFLWYSGMATGMLGGQYTPGDDQIDPKQLTETCGGEFIQDGLVSLNPAKNLAFLASGQSLSYDVLSFNLGSHVDSFSHADPFVWTVKPISNLFKLKEHLKKTYGKNKTARVVVVGGGSTGCEIVANLDALRRRIGIPLSLFLISSGQRLVPQSSPRASRKLQRMLKNRGIDITLNERVTGIKKSKVQTESGHDISYDEIILAHGLSASPILKKCEVALSSKKGLLVNDYLQSVSHPNVFGAGDCIHIDGHPLPKLGVFGVRQGPVLFHNLAALVDGRRLRAYRPQKRYLSILNLGDKTSLALWGPLYWFGRSSFWLKHFIDLRFMRSYKNLYEKK